MKPVKNNISVLFLGTQMEVAGAQRMLLSQARWFSRTGYPVQAVFFYDKQGLIKDWRKENQFPITSLEARKVNSDPISNALRLLRSVWRLFSKLRRNVQVIVTFTPHSNILGLPIAWLAGVPVRIGTHHGYIEGSSRLFAWVHGRLTNSPICSRMVAVSSQVRDREIKQEGASSKRVTVIENGIEPVELRNPTRRLDMRKQLGFADDDLVILTVGRMTIQKGHAYFLDAISRIESRYPRARYLFVGDGPLRSELENQAMTLGISDKVSFLGIRKNVSDLLYIADIFVQPSLWEGLSLALLEALMSGLPVLATRVEGVVDVVEEEKSALLVAPKDPVSLAAALERLLTDPQLRIRLSKAGQALAKENYSIDTMCKSYEQLILNLVPNVS